MSIASPITDVLSNVLQEPTSGVVGLVDDLLKACRDHDLELDWQTNRCRVRCLGGAWQDLKFPELRKSVFRAMLARIAVLCNEHAHDSVSPYGGHGELHVVANPPVVFRVSFTNTADEQRLEISPDYE